MKFKILIRIIILSVFTLCFSAVKSQQVLQKSFPFYDSLTYQQYLSGDWKKLISSGKQALASGYDYKYLRLRLGFAYFNSSDFRLAAENFSEALKYDSYDTVAALYFNLSCPAAGRGTEVYQIKGSKPTYKILESVYADAGKSVMNDSQDSATLSDSATIYQELVRPVSSNFISLGMSIRPSPKLSIYLAYSVVNRTDNQSFAYLTQDAKRDSITELEYERDYYYSYPLVPEYAQRTYNTRQESSYINFSWYPVPGLKITPAFNYLHISTTVLTASPYSFLKTDTAWFNKLDTTWHSFDYTATDYTISSRDTSYTNYVLSLAVNKDVGKFNAGFNGTYARLLDRKYYQFGASLTWYPLGNTNLYTNTIFTCQPDPLKTNFIFEQLAGCRIYKSGWLEGFFTVGEMKNYTEKNAYLVYNQIYPVKMRFGFTFYPYIGKNVEVMLIARFQKIETLLTTYTTEQYAPVRSYPDYKYSTFGLGIKLKM